MHVGGSLPDDPYSVQGSLDLSNRVSEFRREYLNDQFESGSVS